MGLWIEERYSWTPFPERRLRLRILGITMTLWRWDA